MRVLLRCEEDNTLCMVESVNVYRDGDTGAVCVGLFEGEEERVTFDMSEAEYEKRLREALRTGSLDFSDFSFEYSDGSENNDEQKDSFRLQFDSDSDSDSETETYF